MKDVIETTLDDIKETKFVSDYAETIDKLNWINNFGCLCANTMNKKEQVRIVKRLIKMINLMDNRMNRLVKRVKELEDKLENKEDK